MTKSAFVAVQPLDRGPVCAVVQYDPAAGDITTLSIHANEDAAMRDGLAAAHTRPVVKVDKEGRCAVMVVWGRKFVVLPAKDDGDAASAR